MRKVNNRNIEQTEKFSLEEEMHSLEKEDLYNLLQDILEQKPELCKLILEWFKEKQGTSGETGANKPSINDELLMEYWDDAREIISEFNEYGGGSEDDEDEACSYLDRISDLIEEGDISTRAKLKFLDNAFEEYNIDNSGLEDAMMDVFFEICKTKEEWEYLVKKLDEHPSDWRKKLIMDIQKEHLHDDKARICLDKNMKKVVLDTILDPPKNKWGYVLENNFDEFADKLKEEFPEKIIDYYWQISVKNTKGGNRKTYSVAARYIAEAKNVYIDILRDESKWKQRFSDLKAEFKNRPAFLDEVKYL